MRFFSAFLQRMQPALDGTSLGDKYWYYNDKTQFVLIDGDDVTIGAAGDMVLYDPNKLENGDEYTKAVVVKSDKNLAEVVALYVTEYNDGVVVTPSNVTYNVGLLGCAKDSKNVQFIIGKSVDGTFVKWLSADELKALNLTADQIIVNNASKAVALSTEGTGTYSTAAPSFLPCGTSLRAPSPSSTLMRMTAVLPVALLLSIRAPAS